MNEIMNIRSKNDTFMNPCKFSSLYNGVDGKIYVGYDDGNCQTLTYIEHPDIKGQACGLCQNCYSKPSDPTHYTSTAPNQPNYSLGPLKGSPCDTIGKLHFTSITIYPNPATQSVHVFIPLPMHTKMKASLYNIIGQRISKWEQELNSKQEVELSLQDIASGMYLLKIEAGDLSYVGKLAVQ
jgi:hypothetical protein